MLFMYIQQVIAWKRVQITRIILNQSTSRTRAVYNAHDVRMTEIPLRTHALNLEIL